MQTVYDAIHYAIINKKIVIAAYKDFVRKMCPHVLGTVNGRKMVLFYQFEGGSRSRPHRYADSDWRNIRLTD